MGIKALTLLRRSWKFEGGGGGRLPVKKNIYIIKSVFLNSLRRISIIFLPSFWREIQFEFTSSWIGRERHLKAFFALIL